MSPGDITDERAARLRALDWGAILKELTVIGLRRRLSPALAEDIANDVVTRFFQEYAATWDYEADPTAMKRLRRIHTNRRKTLREQAQLRKEILPVVDDSDAADEVAPLSDRGAEAEILRNESATRKRARLRARLEGSPLTLQLVDLFEEEGLIEPAEIAARLGVDVTAVYTAKAQLRRHLDRMQEEGSDPDIQVASAGGAVP